MIAGVLMFAAPEAVYQFTQAWKNDSCDRPSDAYRLTIRIGGVIFFLVGLSGVIGFFIF